MSQPKSTTAPPTFQDAQDRQWQIKLTGSLIDAVQTATKIDLIPDDQDYSPVIQLVTSHRKLGAVLWECVKSQAGLHTEPATGDVTPVIVDKGAFLDGFDGKAYLAGWEALVGAIHFFIQSLNPKRAEAFQAMVEQSMKVIEAEAVVQIELIQSETTDEALKSAVAEIKQKMQGDLTREFANCASSLPESSASTRGRTR